MRIFYTILSIIFFTLTALEPKAQSLTRDSTLVNIGSSIYVGQDNNPATPAPALFIDGDFTNRDSITPSNNFTGTIELFKGDIEIWGNWFNFSNDFIFTNLFGSSSDGTVIFNDLANPQFIAGSQATHFENLFIENTDKFLLTNNNEVNGVLRVDAVLDLNRRKLIIDNASPMAIEYLSKYILSETSPVDGYGQLQWNVGSTNFGTYNIPFGSSISNTNDLNLQINIKQGGLDDASSFTFATYPSDLYNTPFPINTTAITKDPLAIIDRYWIIKPDFQQNPQIDIEFTYTSDDLKPTLNTLIDPPNLKAIRYDENAFSWQSIKAAGKSSPGLKTVRVSDVVPNELYSNWTLASTEVPFADIFIPDAFTPNGDGLNDVFIPIPNLNYAIADFEFYIYDRWGRQVFYSDDITVGWDGNIDGDRAPIGVYNYLIKVKGEIGEENIHKGHVTLVK